MDIDRQRIAAVRPLEALGYTHRGAAHDRRKIERARLVEAFADGEQRLEVAEQLEAVTV